MVPLVLFPLVPFVVGAGVVELIGVGVGAAVGDVVETGAGVGIPVVGSGVEIGVAAGTGVTVGAREGTGETAGGLNVVGIAVGTGIDVCWKTTQVCAPRHRQLSFPLAAGRQLALGIDVSTGQPPVQLLEAGQLCIETVVLLMSQS